MAAITKLEIEALKRLVKELKEKVSELTLDNLSLRKQVGAPPMIMSEAEIELKKVKIATARKLTGY